MADRKISDLTALTTPASGDYVPIVDISEADAASKNKRVTIQSLFQGIPVNVGIGTSSPDAPFHLYGPSYNARIESTVGTDGTLRFINTSGSMTVGMTGAGGNTFIVYDNINTTLAYEYSGAASAGIHKWYTAGTERMRITSAGVLVVGGTAAGFQNDNGVSLEGGAVVARHIVGTGNGTAYHWFIYNSGVIGSITQSGTTAVAYNTTSDYRLKENVTPVPDGITRLQQLKPIRFNFIAEPDRTVDGFLAHEAQAVVPECVTGEKDAVDDDGNPVYQGIDQSKMVPLLTAALQEAIARIETLEAAVAALTG